MKAAAVIMRSGARIDPRSPRLDTIRAADIAEQLGKAMMHNGATTGFYSVAQHSVLVAGEMAFAEGPVAALYALLHHAEDLFGAPSPRLRAALHGAFDLDWPMPVPFSRALQAQHARVHLSELRLLCTGRDDEIAALEQAGVQPIARRIKPLGWDYAMDEFIAALKTNAIAAALPLAAMPAMGGML